MRSENWDICDVIYQRPPRIHLFPRKGRSIKSHLLIKKEQWLSPVWNPALVEVETLFMFNILKNPEKRSVI